MNSYFNDLLTMEFVPLSEAKAKLSEQMRLIASGRRRVGITCNGRPSAVLMSYEDFIHLLRSSEREQGRDLEKTYDFSEWKKSKPKRLKVRDSILGLFDAGNLSRKGQKKYKKEKVREFDGNAPD